MGFGGGGFFFLGFLPMPICEEGRGGQCRVGDGETSGGKRRPSKNPRENRVDDEGTRGSRDARFACRPRVARAGTTVVATFNTRLRSRAGLVDAWDTHLVLYVSDVVVDVRLLQQRLERLALGPARASHRRARPVLVPPSHRAPVEAGIDGEVIFVQSRGRHRACALRSAAKRGSTATEGVKPRD